MRRRLRIGVLGMSGRRLVPLIIFVMALVAITLRYQDQMRRIGVEVEQLERSRLLERLSLEQGRLDIRLSAADPMMLRRIVSGLALHDGMEQAYLVDGQNRVLASLSRSDVGLSLDEALARVPWRARLEPLFDRRERSAIRIDTPAESTLLTALVPLLDGHRLGVLVDMGIPMAQRRVAVQEEVAREALAALAAAGLLAVLLHLLWFRRAQRLAQALKAMGEGDLSQRTGLDGRDELALIGQAADRMAGQLQADRAVALHMSELVARSPLVVIEWRNAPGWPVSYVSDSVSVWGYSPVDLLDGKLHYNELLHPDDLQWVNAELKTYFADGPDDYRQEYRIRRADGGWAWVDDRTSLTRDAAGEVVGISGVLLDVTAQREAENAQREQAELLRMFYELPFLGMAISSPADKRWLQVNDRLCEILGYPRDELLRKSWSEMTPPGDLERNVALFDELLAGRRNGYQMAKRFVRKDGRMVHTEIEVRALRHADGSVKQLFATVQDVSERVAADEALRASESLLLEAQRIGRMGSWSYDITRDVSTWSDGMFRIHGRDPSKGSTPYGEYLSSVHEADRDTLDKAYQHAVSHGVAMRVSYRWVAPDGTPRHLMSKGEPVIEQGQVVRLVGLIQDETELVLAQRERDRLVSVLEATTDIVSMADPQGRVFYFNRAGYEILGLDRDEPLDDAMSKVHPPWAARRVREEAIPAAMASGQWLGETAVYDTQGREVPMSQMVIAHHDHDGRLIYFSAILRDITERKATESALRDQGRLLAEAQEVSRMGNWSVDISTGHVFWSQGLFAIMGLDPDTQVATTDAFMASVHPDDRARVGLNIQDHLRASDGVTKELEYRVLTPGGVRFVETRARLDCDAQGHPVRLFGTTMDVTDRVIAQREVQDYKDMLEQAEAQALLGSWSGEIGQSDLKISDQLLRNVGLDPRGIPSDEAYIARIHPDDRVAVIEDMQRIRGDQPVGDLVFRTDPSLGPMRWLRRTVKRFAAENNGRGPRYIGTLLDITESVRAEEHLRHINLGLERRVAERTAQLSQANQELEAFSYSVSHDLKAPLRGIDGYSQLLVDEYGDKLDEEGRQFVRRIRQGVQQMGELISDMLEYSRMERRDMSHEPVALLPLVQQILQGYEVDIERQRAQVQLDMEPFTLALDREGMAVVLRNLIGNALKFSRDSQPPTVQIGSRREPGRRVLWVRDNGVGFNMKYHDRMFGIFQRLHRAEEFPGTGVGLALVAKAVQRMGGRVWAESEPGAGATFYLEFPE